MQKKALLGLVKRHLEEHPPGLLFKNVRMVPHITATLEIPARNLPASALPEIVVPYFKTEVLPHGK